MRRTVLFGVGVMCLTVLLLLGVLFSSNVSDNNNKDYAVYNKALKINNDIDMFQNNFNSDKIVLAYGTFESLGSASYPELKSNYLYVRKVKQLRSEVKTQEVQMVGETPMLVDKVDYVWKTQEDTSKKTEMFSFLGSVFLTSSLDISKYMETFTIYENDDLRNTYYVIPEVFDGVILVKLENDSISNALDNTQKVPVFYSNNLTNVMQTIEQIDSNKLTTYWVLGTFSTFALLVLCYILFKDTY